MLFENRTWRTIKGTICPFFAISRSHDGCGRTKSVKDLHLNPYADRCGRARQARQNAFKCRRMGVVPWGGVTQFHDFNNLVKSGTISSCHGSMRYEQRRSSGFHGLNDRFAAIRSPYLFGPDWHRDRSKITEVSCGGGSEQLSRLCGSVSTRVRSGQP